MVFVKFFLIFIVFICLLAYSNEIQHIHVIVSWVAYILVIFPLPDILTNTCVPKAEATVAKRLPSI